MKNDNNFQNPIDKDHITDNPSGLEYPHHRGSAIVKAEDKGKIKGRALAAMEQQTSRQMDQIQEQIELLAKQAKKLKSRVEISETIYQAKMSFEPLVGHDYYLYETDAHDFTLSLLSPADWGKRLPHIYKAKVSLLADHTWDVLDLNESNI